MRDLRFGAGTGRVWLADLRCTGNEDHVLQCYSSVALGKGTAYQHSEDAGVTCQLCKHYLVQYMLQITIYKASLVQVS